MCPEWILKDDNYYYVFNHRCENIKDVPATYIHGVCSKFKIRNYTINDDYTIDVMGDVYLDDMSLDKIPFKFNIVSGDFLCGFNKLTTLEGSPESVGEYFYCYYNKLITLKGGPKRVGKDFDCSYNELTTLEGSPVSVGRDFHCYNNPLTTLKDGPKSVGGKVISRDIPDVIVRNY